MEQVCFGGGQTKLQSSDTHTELLEREHRGLFERPAKSFSFDERIIDWIKADEANPLNRISKIIDSGSNVLDVGAGNGILARLIQSAKNDVVIDAIEPDPEALRYALPVYNSIFKGNLREYLDEHAYQEKNYDFIVLADVVEHISDPELILQKLKSLLKPNGKLIISTPNIAFASVRLALLKGRFDYVDSGILERTHLRFYTRETLLELFKRINISVHSEYHCVRNPLKTEINLLEFNYSPFTLMSIAIDKISSVYQFLFVLETSPSVDTVVKVLGKKSYCLPIEYLALKIKKLICKAYKMIRNKT